MVLLATKFNEQKNIQQFCFMIKSYSKDIKYVERLISSIIKFNLESIKTFIIIPESDFADFKKFTSDLTEIIFEESLPTLLATGDVDHYRKGYINQAILKLAFHRLNLTSSYMCLDSDFEFIRPFTYSDFLTTNGEPYTVLIEDNERATRSLNSLIALKNEIEKGVRIVQQENLQLRHDLELPATLS